MKSFKSIGRCLVLITAILFSADQIAAVKQPATITKTSTIGTSSTKPKAVSPKPTSTNPKPTKTTPSHITKSQTSKVKTYNWSAVSSRPNCPTYFPTEGLATKTISANGGAATMFIDLHGGTVPKQFASTTENGDSLIVKTTNNTQLTIFSPNHFLMIVDNNGITVFDIECQEGGRIHVPNFLNMSSAISSATVPGTSTRSTPSRSRAKEKRAPAADQKGDFHIDFRFVDQCGVRVPADVVNATASFSCSCLTPYLKLPTSLSSYAVGAYEAKIHGAPFFSDIQACKSSIDALANWVTKGPIHEALESQSLVANVLKLVSLAGGSAIVSSLGMGAIAPWLAGGFAAAGILDYYLEHVGPGPLENLLCTPQGLNYNYQLTANTFKYGAIQVDAQTGPLTNVASQVIVLPTKVHDPCTTTYPVNSAWNNNECQIPRPTPQPEAAQCPPKNSDDYGYHSGCGRYGYQCVCASDVNNKPLCLEDFQVLDCKTRGCSSDDDCPCGGRCTGYEGFCGFPVCVAVSNCLVDRDVYSDDYYDYAKKKRAFIANETGAAHI